VLLARSSGPRDVGAPGGGDDAPPAHRRFASPSSPIMRDDASADPSASLPLSRRTFVAGSLAAAAGALTEGLAPDAAAALPGRKEAWPASAPPGDLTFATARDAAAAIRRRAVSSRELTERMLARIERHQPALRAMATVTGDAALAAARAADAALARGAALGPLHGVPITIKDAFAMAGVRTTAGADFLKDHVPAEDAAAVARLRAAGAVILGNTNVPAMLSDWQSYNAIFGASNNPYDVARTPGGSTGGGAAALAAGLCYLTLGSDIGGSIRVPAHFCGVYGHKPTFGVVSKRGHIPPPPGAPPGDGEELAVAGPLARSAGDLALALRVLGGPAGDDAVAYRWELPAPRQTALRAYRVGYVLDDPRCPVSDEVRPALDGALDALRRAGVQLVEGWPEGVDASRQYDAYRFLLARAIATVPDDAVPPLRARAERQDGSWDALHALAVSAPWRRHAVMDGVRRAGRAAWQRWFRTHDAFLMPTAFVPAFPHDHRRSMAERTLATPAGARGYDEMMFWISFATLTGLPATTAPVGRTAAGLPVGIQILGPFLEDATPIDLAERLAGVVGGFVPPAGYGV
jgi:amidase